MWYSATEIISFLLIAKKIILRYGLLVGKKEIMNKIYEWNKDVGSIIAILFQLGYKTNDAVENLIKRVQQILKSNYCTIELLDENNWNETMKNITTTLEKIQSTDVLVEKKLNSAWLHISTNTHRYHRDIDTDLNIMLR